MKILFTLLAFVALTASPALAQTYNVAGDFNGWDNAGNPMYDDGTNGDLVAGDGIHSVEIVIPTAGRYEWKATAFGSWDSSWPISGNSWMITSSDNETVLFTFDSNVPGDGWLPDGNVPHSSHTRGDPYVLVGSLGSELGGADWDPAGSLVLHDDGLDGDIIAGDGVYTFVGDIATAGTYEWKVAVNNDWGEQFGADGPSINASTVQLEVTDPVSLRFLLDTNSGRITWALDEDPVDTESSSWGAVKESFR